MGSYLTIKSFREKELKDLSKYTSIENPLNLFRLDIIRTKFKRFHISTSAYFLNIKIGLDTLEN